MSAVLSGRFGAQAGRTEAVLGGGLRHRQAVGLVGAPAAAAEAAVKGRAATRAGQPAWGRGFGLGS